jgi:hypothetical protein
MRSSRKPYYDPGRLEDAPEHHELARSLGTLSWGTWDSGLRPVDDRVADFVAAYPPDNPARHLGGFSVRKPDGSAVPSTPEALLKRLLARDCSPGSLYELAARFGLRFRDAPPQKDRPFEPADMKSAARKRNLRLRVLHGGVDVEPGDMNAAKAALLERQEKQHAAEQVRAARRRMLGELGSDDEK